MDKRKLLAALLSGKISRAEFEKEARDLNGVVIGVETGGNVTWTDSDDGEGKTGTEAEFQALGEVYTAVLIRIIGEEEPVLSEEDIQDID